MDDSASASRRRKTLGIAGATALGVLAFGGAGVAVGTGAVTFGPRRDNAQSADWTPPSGNTQPITAEPAPTTPPFGGETLLQLRDDHGFTWSDRCWHEPNRDPDSEFLPPVPALKSVVSLTLPLQDAHLLSALPPDSQAKLASGVVVEQRTCVGNRQQFMQDTGVPMSAIGKANKSPLLVWSYVDAAADKSNILSQELDPSDFRVKLTSAKFEGTSGSRSLPVAEGTLVVGGVNISRNPEQHDIYDGTATLRLSLHVDDVSHETPGVNQPVSADVNVDSDVAQFLAKGPDAIIHLQAGYAGPSQDDFVGGVPLPMTPRQAAPDAGIADRPKLVGAAYEFD